MTSAAQKLRVSFADYIAAEVQSDQKHQLVDGEVFLMTGGTPAHASLITNLGAALHTLLRGRPCRPFVADLRIRAGDLVTYPDCSVVCGPLQVDPEDRNTVLNPTVIVEVLSESTERFDRGRKAEQYRRIPSLRDYLLVSQTEPHVELFRRTEAGWLLLEAGPGAGLQLESIGCRLEIDAVCEGVFEAVG